MNTATQGLESECSGDRAAESSETAEFEAAFLALAASIPPVEPPPAIKAAVLGAIATPKGFVFRFAGEASFRPTPTPGVTFRLLHRDKSRGVVTCLLRMAPGARLPAHSHRGAEECVVLEGTILVGPTRMRAGDYQRAEADSDHVEQWTDTGALVYLSGPEDLFV